MYFVLILYPSSIVIVLISHKTLSLPVLCCHFLLLTLSLPSYRGTNRPPPLLTCCAAPYHINTFTCLVCNGIIGIFIHYNLFFYQFFSVKSFSDALREMLLFPVFCRYFLWNKIFFIGQNSYIVFLYSIRTLLMLYCIYLVYVGQTTIGSSLWFQLKLG